MSSTAVITFQDCNDIRSDKDLQNSEVNNMAHCGKAIFLFLVLCPAYLLGRPKWMWINEESVDEMKMAREGLSRDLDEKKVKKEDATPCTTCDCCPISTCHGNICVL